MGPFRVRFSSPAELESAHDRLLLSLLVLCVRGLAELVVRFGVPVDDLEFADDENDVSERRRARRRSFEDAFRQAHGHVDDEMNDTVGLGRKLVLARREVVTDAAVNLHLAEKPLERSLLEVRLEGEDRIDALTGDDVIERKELGGEVLHDWENVVARSSDDTEPQLVENLCGDGFLLR